MPPLSQSQRIEFVQYVFCTLTFARPTSGTGLHDSWMDTPRLWNRYIQRIRRLHGFPVHYLRTVEAHKDLYPHIHALLDFGSAKIRVTNTKFFDQNLYTAWKNQWLRGHSDYQRPYTRGTANSLLYIIKYITKDSTKKTIWRKVYSHANVKMRGVPRSSELQTPNKLTVSPVSNMDAKAIATTPHLPDPSSFFCKQYKIKQCTWSRGFKFPTIQPKSLLVSQSLFNPSTN